MLETLEQLLKRYVNEKTYSFQQFDVLNVNSIGLEDETPLHMACSRNAQHDVQLLVESGANVNAKDEIGGTPLHRAVSAKCLPIVLFLLKFGANPKASNDYGRTPIEIALERGDADIIEVLAKYVDRS
jgi:ankyrin repeat protein